MPPGLRTQRGRARQVRQAPRTHLPFLLPQARREDAELDLPSPGAAVLLSTAPGGAKLLRNSCHASSYDCMQGNPVRRAGKCGCPARGGAPACSGPVSGAAPATNPGATLLRHPGGGDLAVDEHVTAVLTTRGHLGFPAPRGHVLHVTSQANPPARHCVCSMPRCRLCRRRGATASAHRRPGPGRPTVLAGNGNPPARNKADADLSAPHAELPRRAAGKASPLGHG